MLYSVTLKYVKMLILLLNNSNCVIYLFQNDLQILSHTKFSVNVATWNEQMKQLFGLAFIYGLL